MYLDFFGFREKPFTITPNPRFLFFSKNHKDVFAHLLYGIRNRTGFIEVTGEVGAGKTTVLRTLFQQLEGDDYRLAFIFNPSLSAGELLQSICRELNVATDSPPDGSLLDALNAYLLRENRAGRTVVLVIDEAQNLAPAVLEQVRLLSNLETDSDKLIQIVLVGQPELATVLERSELRQLSQRITVRYHLRPMEFDDTRAYIRHRLELAGCRERELFAPRAVRAIYRLSGGLPRLINVYCDRALLVAFSEDRPRVDLAAVRQARRELRRETAGKGRRRWTAAALLLILLGILLALNIPGSSPDPAVKLAAKPPAAAKAPPAKMVAATPAKPKIGPVETASLRQALAAIAEPASAAVAFSAVSERWGEPPLATPELAMPDGLQPAATQRHLIATPYSGSLERLLRLDTPVIIELSLPGVAGRRYLALTASFAQGLAIAPRLAGRDRLSAETLRSLWTGQAWLLWRNYAGLPFLARAGEDQPGVARLQTLLAGLDPQLPASGRFDASTIAAVTQLQARRGILQDGRVGPQTLVLLYQEVSAFAPPRLAAATGGGL